MRDTPAKKVLIVTYYWPPSGGSGVQRWLKFVKYLPQFGWTPHVFTPQNPSFSIRDESLMEDIPAQAQIIRFPIWEPYDVFLTLLRLVGRDKKLTQPADLITPKTKSLFQLVTTWIRGNFFIPDPRVFWVRPSVSFLKKYIKENNITTIVTTGPPHSIHLIGYKLKRKIPSLNWLADFRDPWTKWGLLDSLLVSPLVRRIHKRLELKVLRTADSIITITPFYVRQFEEIAGRSVQLLTNGYDEDDFQHITYLKQNTFLIRHVGIINEKCNPRPFMIALKEFIGQRPGAERFTEVEFIGEVHPDFKRFVFEDTLLSMICKFAGNIPHKQLLNTYGKSSLLLLVLTGYKDAEGFMPGKLFEYLATGLPILGIGPSKGDASTLLRETNAGIMVEETDVDQIKSYLNQKFEAWQVTNTLLVERKENALYTRRAITRRLIDLFR